MTSDFQFYYYLDTAKNKGKSYLICTTFDSG